MDALHHSATVHIPMAMAVFFPLAYILGLLLVRVRFLPERAWLLGILAAVIQVVSVGLALRTGQRDLAFSAAAADLLHQHQELGEVFFRLWLGISVIYTLAFASKPKVFARLCHGVLLVLLVLQLYQAVQLGHLGGQIVFGQ